MADQSEPHVVDRSGWDSGPWDGEPDKLEWRDSATGLPCLIVRNRMGNLCGYAGIHTGHPLFGKAYSACVQGCDQKPRRTKAQRKFALKKAKKAKAQGDSYADLSLSLLRMEKRDESRKPKGIRLRHAYRYGPLYRRSDCKHDTAEGIFEVHGGITYADSCQGSICHVPEPGERRVWWFGFDCGHHMDISPGMQASLRKVGMPPWEDFGEVYRDINYVKAEVTSLARQLADWRK